MNCTFINECEMLRKNGATMSVFQPTWRPVLEPAQSVVWAFDRLYLSREIQRELRSYRERSQT